MRLPEKQAEWQVRGWKVGLVICPGILNVGVWWDGNRGICSPKASRNAKMAAVSRSGSNTPPFNFIERNPNALHMAFA